MCRYARTKQGDQARSIQLFSIFNTLQLLGMLQRVCRHPRPQPGKWSWTWARRRPQSGGERPGRSPAAAQPPEPGNFLGLELFFALCFVICVADPGERASLSEGFGVFLPALGRLEKAG